MIKYFIRIGQPTNYEFVGNEIMNDENNIMINIFPVLA